MVAISEDRIPMTKLTYMPLKNSLDVRAVSYQRSVRPFGGSTKPEVLKDTTIVISMGNKRKNSIVNVMNRMTRITTLIIKMKMN